MSPQNYQFGPQIFWLMCGGVLVANFVFFLSSGYLSWERTYKLIVEDKSHEKSVAMVEEQRRQTESQMHREAAVFGLFEASRFTTSADRWNQPKNGPGPAQMRPSAQVISPMVVEKISDSRRGDNVTY